MDRDRYDIVLFGSTGFTGQVIAEYLVQHASREGLTIALAGRDPDKGARLISELQSSYPGSVVPDWLTANLNDPESMKAMASRARVVMNAAGPFALYGLPVVEACVQSGAHYLDITGEPDYVHDVHRLFDEAAQKRGVSVISACGFDSLPADLGTYCAVEALKDRSRVSVWSFFRTNAQFSGGTWHTAILAIHRRMTGKRSPRPSGHGSQRSRKLPIKLHFSKRVKRWALPMPVLDPHIVKRSARAMPDIYGPSFAYAQFFTTGSFLKILRIVVPIAAVFLVVRIGAVRRWLLSRNPSGSGPDKAARARARFEVRIFAENGTEHSEVVFSGNDPGYDETAKMFSESAFCLLDHMRSGTVKAGVLSPAYALGMPLVDRLRKSGIRIELRS